MYDIAIVGGGPAALTAAIYAIRYKMNAIVIASEWGGYMNYAHLVENWPSETSITGIELANKIIEHTKSTKIPMIQANVQAIEKNKKGFVLTTPKEEYEAERIILASGTERTKLNIEGESEFLGKGVSYCATCDGFFFRGKTVAVIGSGDSACTSAVYLADIAKKVYLMYRSDNLKAEPIWIDKVKNNDKVELLATTMPTKINGDSVVRSMDCDDNKTREVDGIFVEVGSTPSDFLINKLGIKIDKSGYVIVDPDQKTNVAKVWAAGDITTNSSKFKQMVTAASEGAVAVFNAYIDAKS